MEKKKIIILEDNAIIRNGLISLIEQANDLVLVKAFQRGEDLLKEAKSIKADLFLMDIHLVGGISGIETMKQLKPLFPKATFVVLTIFEDADYVFDALRAGAVGYLLKSTSSEIILESIRDALKGGSPMSGQIARKVVDAFANQLLDDSQENFNLTQRETEIIDLLSKGFRYKEIAEHLFISKETVRTHIRNVYGKLEVRSNTEAIIKYLKNK